MTFKEAFNPQNNSFDFLRFALAFAVIVVHGYWLGGFGPDPINAFSHGQIDLGPVAVAGFFLLSGFLITRSRNRIASFWQYLWQRCRRIFPGFWVCLLVTVVLFGPIIYFIFHNTLNGYWTQNPFGPFDYLTHNFLLRINQDRIGDLFAGNPLYPYLINGSLWTLYDEFKCYIIVGILGIFGVLKNRRWVVLLLTGLVLVALIFEYITNQDLLSILPFFLEQTFLEHLAYFMIGSCAYLYAERIPMSRWMFIVSVALCIISGYINYYHVVSLFAYSYALFWLAFSLPITRWAKYGDLSYSTYLYAFPIQRILAQIGLTQIGVVPFILIAFAITSVFAVASYHLVEKRFFKRNAAPAKLPTAETVSVATAPAALDAQVRTSGGQ